MSDRRAATPRLNPRAIASTVRWPESHGVNTASVHPVAKYSSIFEIASEDEPHALMLRTTVLGTSLIALRTSMLDAGQLSSALMASTTSCGKPQFSAI